jgi:hypothetical protein
MFFVPTITAQMFVSDMTAVLPSKPGNPQHKSLKARAPLRRQRRRPQNLALCTRKARV